MAPTWPAMEYAERSKPQGSASVRSHIAERANISMADITPNNVGQLHMLNAKLFPIVYVKELYKVQGEDVKPLCKLGLFNDIPVGDICCTLEDGPDETTWKIYIMTLGVLPSYRRLGIATALLNHVLENAPVGGMFAGRRVHALYLHVQTSNVAARAFYEKNGFVVSDKIEGYYSQLEPQSAWVLEKHT